MHTLGVIERKFKASDHSRANVTNGCKSSCNVLYNKDSDGPIKIKNKF